MSIIAHQDKPRLRMQDFYDIQYTCYPTAISMPDELYNGIIDYINDNVHAWVKIIDEFSSSGKENIDVSDKFYDCPIIQTINSTARNNCVIRLCKHGRGTTLQVDVAAVNPCAIITFYRH